MPSPTRLVSSLLHHRSSAASIIPLYTIARHPIGHSPLRPFQQTRNRYVKREGADFATPIGRDSLTSTNVYLLPRTERELAQAGLDKNASMALLYAVVARAWSGWKPSEAFEAFQNYVKWKKDSTSVPVKWQKPTLYYLNCIVRDGEGFDQAQLDTLPANEVSEALLILGKQSLLMAVVKYDLNGAITSSDLHVAMFVLEIATKYRNTNAAVLLVNISEDAAVRYWHDELVEAGEKSVMPNVSGAKSLVRESVTKNPSQCSWRTIVTYMRDECRESNIMRQTPNQLTWAIDILRLAVEDLEPGRALQAEHAYTEEEGDMPLKFFKLQECENPWKVLHRIVNHSLRIKASLPNYSASELLHLREKCLSELVSYNDPNASFTVAIRDQELGTADWENLIKCAAAGGISDANWLLAAFYLAQNQSLIPIGKLPFQNRRATQLAVEYAGVAAHISLAEAPIEQSRSGRESVCVNRILAHTALMKTVEGYEIGGKTFSAYLEDLRDTPGVASGLIARLQTHHDDYMRTDKMLDEHWSWSKVRCLDMIRNGFDMDRTYQLAWRGRDYWDYPT